MDCSLLYETSGWSVAKVSSEKSALDDYDLHSAGSPEYRSYVLISQIESD